MDRPNDGKHQIKDLEIGLTENKHMPKLEPDSLEADIQPQSLQFRVTRKSTRFGSRKATVVILSCILVLIGSLSVTLRLVPAVREPAIELVKEWTDVAKNEEWFRFTPALAKITKILKLHRPAKKSLAAAAGTVDFSSSCSEYVKDALNKKVKAALSDVEYVHLINCELFQDTPKYVLQTLERKKLDFSHGTTWDALPLDLLALEATRRMNPFSALANYSKQSCTRWASSSDCLMRYVDESRAPFKSRWADGLAILSGDVSRQEPNVQAWFQLSSALYAIKDREFAKAQTFLESASLVLQAEPNPYLEREIYRNSVLNAYLAKDGNLVRRSLALKPLKRIEQDPNAFLDVDLLQILNKKSKTELDNYMSQSEAIQRFGSDPRIVSIILSQTQILDLEIHGLSFAEAVYGRREIVRIEALNESMALLYARMWMGANKSLEALEILSSIEKAGFHSAELYHLKGLAQLLSFKKSELKLVAAKDLQTAASMSRNEESLFALVVALLDAKDQSKADQVLDQWKMLGPSSQKTIWYGFARGLVSYCGGNKLQSKALWDANEHEFPNNPIWLKLKTNLSEDVGYLDTDLARRLMLMMSNDSPLGSLALFGQKS